MALFLSNLPSRGSFTSFQSQGHSTQDVPTYTCVNDTSPPADQIIRTDSTNILIRAMTKSIPREEWRAHSDPVGHPTVHKRPMDSEGDADSDGPSKRQAVEEPRRRIDLSSLVPKTSTMQPLPHPPSAEAEFIIRPPPPAPQAAFTLPPAPHYTVIPQAIPGPSASSSSSRLTPPGASHVTGGGSLGRPTTEGESSSMAAEGQSQRSINNIMDLHGMSTAELEAFVEERSAQPSGGQRDQMLQWATNLISVRKRTDSA